MTKSKYDHLIKPLPFKKGPGGANARELTWLYGKDLNGFAVNFAYGIYSEPGNWHDWAPGGGNGAHVHPYDEVLIFVGHNTDDLSNLGAEIELSLGEEQEKHIITNSTVVTIPKNMVHCPVVTKKVEQPFSFFLISLDPKPQYKWLGKVK
jgi:hypothetical protein